MTTSRSRPRTGLPTASSTISRAVWCRPRKRCSRNSAPTNRASQSWKRNYEPPEPPRPCRWSPAACRHDRAWHRNQRDSFTSARLRIVSTHGERAIVALDRFGVSLEAIANSAFEEVSHAVRGVQHQRLVVTLHRLIQIPQLLQRIAFLHDGRGIVRGEHNGLFETLDRLVELLQIGMGFPLVEQ